MPTITVLYTDPLIGSLFSDAFRLDGWITHSVRVGSDPESLFAELEKQHPQLLLIEFHPRWEAAYKTLVRAVRTHDVLRHTPMLLSHYDDEPLDGLRQFLSPRDHAVLTHPYDVETLFDAARRLARTTPE